MPSNVPTYNIICGNSERRAGFTLIELSIVIVIIGLLLGGVLVGQDLIRSAELQAIATDHQRYKGAAKQFQDQYYALPGDFSQATTVWPTAGGCPGGAATLGKETCDGNGNGRVGDLFVALDHPEVFRFWQQLNAAEILEDDFTGVAGAGGTMHAIPETNVPASTVGGAGFTATWIGDPGAGDALLFQGNYTNAMIFGSARADGPTDQPTLTPQEALGIDEKLDDGRPGQGKVLANWSGNCTDAASGATAAAQTAVYQSANAAFREQILCALFFRNAF
jgi:prepilin-type N-terminal cleavage/methylation domain-containing protein